MDLSKKQNKKCNCEFEATACHLPTSTNMLRKGGRGFVSHTSLKSKLLNFCKWYFIAACALDNL